MSAFESFKAYSEFAFYVRRKCRHVMDDKQRRFLDAIVKTINKRARRLNKGKALWRARVGHGTGFEILWGEDDKEIDRIEIEAPLGRKEMIPLEDRAHEGRVNPKGIPCLYCSTDRDTAMTEVRPWIGSYVSVAQFVTVRDLKIVTCIDDQEVDILEAFDEESGTPEKREQHAWGCINNAFSEPVTRGDDVADYAPTQVIAETFRHAGFDGLVYGSKLGKGKSVALFDLNAAQQANCFLFQLDAINPVFSQVGAPDYYTVNT